MRRHPQVSYADALTKSLGLFEQHEEMWRAFQAELDKAAKVLSTEILKFPAILVPIPTESEAGWCCSSQHAGRDLSKTRHYTVRLQRDPDKSRGDEPVFFVHAERTGVTFYFYPLEQTTRFSVSAVSTASSLASAVATMLGSFDVGQAIARVREANRRWLDAKDLIANAGQGPSDPVPEVRYCTGHQGDPEYVPLGGGCCCEEGVRCDSCGMHEAG